MKGIAVGAFTRLAHWAFLDYVRQSSGGNVYALSNALGHTSLIAMTERYLKSFDRKATDQLADSM